MRFFGMEARTGIEPVIRVLQTLALPLGHLAVLMLAVSGKGPSAIGPNLYPKLEGC